MLPVFFTLILYVNFSPAFISDISLPFSSTAVFVISVFCSADGVITFSASDFEWL